MATIDVKTNVTGPSEINIPLVRADQAATANVFRVCFEVFLSLFSTVLGYVLAIQDISRIHWLFLIVCGGAALAFLILTQYFSGEAKKV